MKKLMVMIALTSLLLIPQLVLADTVATVDGYGIYQTGQGGEFTLKASGSTLPGLIDLYVAGKTSNVSQVTGTFQTFCLEHAEYIYPNTTFDATLNSNAMNGGADAAQYNGAGDPISIGTAYLYYEFAKGTLAYNYTGNRTASAALLQNAIWALEGEIADPTDNMYYNLVKGMFVDAEEDSNGAYGVKVLNLTVNGAGRQDQLILTSVPEPASLLLFGLGLLGLAGIRRKMK